MNEISRSSEINHAIKCQPGLSAEVKLYPRGLDMSGWHCHELLPWGPNVQCKTWGLPTTQVLVRESLTPILAAIIAAPMSLGLENREPSCNKNSGPGVDWWMVRYPNIDETGHRAYISPVYQDEVSFLQQVGHSCFFLGGQPGHMWIHWHILQWNYVWENAFSEGQVNLLERMKPKNPHKKQPIA